MAKTAANIGLNTAGTASYTLDSTHYFIGNATIQGSSSSSGSLIFSVTGPSVIAGACSFEIVFSSAFQSDVKKPIVAGPGDAIHCQSAGGGGGSVWLSGFLYDVGS